MRLMRFFSLWFFSNFLNIFIGLLFIFNSVSFPFISLILILYYWSYSFVEGLCNLWPLSLWHICNKYFFSIFYEYFNCIYSVFCCTKWASCLCSKNLLYGLCSFTLWLWIASKFMVTIFKQHTWDSSFFSVKVIVHLY